MTAGLTESLDSKVLSLEGVERRTSRWGHKVAYWTRNREFAHFHDETELDIRVTKNLEKGIRKILADPRIRLRPRPSDWIRFEMRSLNDVEAAFKLVKLAWRNNRIVQT